MVNLYFGILKLVFVCSILHNVQAYLSISQLFSLCWKQILFHMTGPYPQVSEYLLILCFCILEANFNIIWQENLIYFFLCFQSFPENPLIL